MAVSQFQREVADKVRTVLFNTPMPVAILVLQNIPMNTIIKGTTDSEKLHSHNLFFEIKKKKRYDTYERKRTKLRT